MNTLTILILFILASFPNFEAGVLGSESEPPIYGNEGAWELLQESIGISAMHMQLLRNDKVIMFDRTDFGPSNLSLPDGHCRMDPSDEALQLDCTAHSLLYDISSNTFRPLMLQTDTWCSSASVLPNGTLLQTGGFNDGQLRIRMFSPCFDHDDSCDWLEFPNYLLHRRWYASNQILPDGRIIVVGGRKQFNYEFYPRKEAAFHFNFLQQTSDHNENNLYPFLHLLPDGNLFIFANTRSILFDYNQNLVLKEFPRIPGEDPRNYPSSGSSVLLPLDDNKPRVEAEIIICGGAPYDSYNQAEQGSFLPALSTCGRLKVTDPNPHWVMVTMPMPRVMGDMLLLPTGDVAIINGAAFGTAGWDHGRQAVFSPLIYRPLDGRFKVMSAATTPRVYHSSAILLPDGRVLIGGSNPNVNYTFSGVEFPTELSLEAFSPPYLSPEFIPLRPTITSTTCNSVLGYRVLCDVTFKVKNYTSSRDVGVRIVAPSFTTHSFSMNQRMVVLNLVGVKRDESKNSDTYSYATVVGPSSAQVAPPGFYMLFLVHAGVPSAATWMHLL